MAKILISPSKYLHSKLSIKIDGEWKANYDRGWDIEPADEETNIAYSILLNEYN